MSPQLALGQIAGIRLGCEVPEVSIHAGLGAEVVGAEHPRGVTLGPSNPAATHPFVGVLYAGSHVASRNERNGHQHGVAYLHLAERYVGLGVLSRAVLAGHGNPFFDSKHVVSSDSYGVARIVYRALEREASLVGAKRPVASLLPLCICLRGVGGYAAKPELARASTFVSTVATYIFHGKGIRDTKYWISVQYRYLTILVRERGGYGSYTAPESGRSLSATGFSGVAFSGSYTSLPAQGERA